MTGETRDELLARLVRKLRLEDLDEDLLTLLEDELDDAEAEILLELRMDELEERFFSKLVELAAVYYRQDAVQMGDVKSHTYTEGKVSESETYFTPDEFKQQERAILNSLKRYRQVRC